MQKLVSTCLAIVALFGSVVQLGPVFTALAQDETEPAEASQSVDAQPCTLNDRFPPISARTNKPFSELLAVPPASDAQARFLGAWQGTMNGEIVRLVVFPSARLQYVWASMQPGQDLQAYHDAVVKDGLTWVNGPRFQYNAALQDDGTLALHQTRADGSTDGALSRCSVTMS